MHVKRRSYGVALRLYKASISASRESGRPAARINCSRMSNSTVVSSTGLPSQRTSRAAGSRVTPLTSSLAGGSERGRRTALDRSDARHEFAGVEGLWNVVVRAVLQANNAIWLVAPRGQHQNRHATLLPDTPKDFESVACPEA